MTTPNHDRPEMPEGYGVDQAKGYVTWPRVEEKLVESLNYWLSTTRADGRPHVVPRWGVWLDGRFWYDGSPETIHVRNLTTNPSCTVHLESGTDVVIVEGESCRPDPISGDLGAKLSVEYARKYGPEYTPTPDAWSDEIAGGMRYIAPTKALAWTDFPNDLTRFSF